MEHAFDELKFWAYMKKWSVLYLGKKTLCGLRDFVNGMELGFQTCGRENEFKYFSRFVARYNERLMQVDGNGYACWWNHLMYLSGGCEQSAFDLFYLEFEKFLRDEYGVRLPENVERL